MIFGRLMMEKYLQKVQGEVQGRIVTDAKNRGYRQKYKFRTDSSNIFIAREDGYGDEVCMPKVVPIDESLVAFFGLYSGDGAKGSDDPARPGFIKPNNISFSQTEPHLVRFAADQFRRLFSGSIRFSFSLGEDSAFFMAGLGEELLKAYYHGEIPQIPALRNVRPALDSADQKYIQENRLDDSGSNEEHLAFYYFHKGAMESILTVVKQKELESVGIILQENDKVTASLRRPFKKGARQPGGTSRADELHIGGLNGFGELFLKIMHEIEDSLLNNTKTSTGGLVEWNNVPSQIGNPIDIKEFFENNAFGQQAGVRPKIKTSGVNLVGRWPHSTEVKLRKNLLISPLWCYTAGLYLAEGSTAKSKLFELFSTKTNGCALGFTSSEGASIELMLRSFQMLFEKEQCIESWKIKVGSQYFPELVVVGMKQGVPMLRGGEKGEGKLRTMEISLAIREWALSVADEGYYPSLLRENYGDRFTHVEPTGSGVARIDFSASSANCKWYFPLLMYAVFGNIIQDPSGGFYR